MRQTIVAGNWKMNASKETVNTLVLGVLEGMSDVKSSAPKSLSMSALTSPVKAPEALTFRFCAPNFRCECATNPAPLPN
jgi:triosephosphate isomerase